MSQLIEFEEQDTYLKVWLNSPSEGNALSLQMLTELLELIKKFPGKHLLLGQRGPVFCAGGNLRFYKSLQSREEGLRINQKIRKGLEKLHATPILKVCVVDGLCVGGGVEFTTCFDFIVATPRAFFGLWQRRVGLTYGWGGEKRLLMRLSSAHLRQWHLNASTKSAYEAHHLGLVDQVISWSESWSYAENWLLKTAKLSPQSLEDHLDRNAQSENLFEKQWLGPDHQKALSRFK